jgi:hypothetical protein
LVLEKPFSVPADLHSRFATIGQKPSSRVHRLNTHSGITVSPNYSVFKLLAELARGAFWIECLPNQCCKKTDDASENKYGQLVLKGQEKSFCQSFVKYQASGTVISTEISTSSKKLLESNVTIP